MWGTGGWVVSAWVGSWCVVGGYYYRRFFGVWAPFLRFVSPEGCGSFILWGHHTFVFGGRYCWMCGAPLIGGGLGLCERCYCSVRGLRYRLVVEGYEKVYDPSMREIFGDLIDRRYYLYVGAFGPLYKVGITSADRMGSRRGYLTRLAEQGFGLAAVIDAGLNLIGAQDAERDIADSFGIRDRLHFDDKIMYVSYEHDEQEFRGLVEDVARFVRGKVVWFGRFSWPGFVDFDSVFDEGFLCGGFVFRRGNIVVVSNCCENLAVNLNGLVGRGIASWEV